MKNEATNKTRIGSFLFLLFLPLTEAMPYSRRTPCKFVRDAPSEKPGKTKMWRKIFSFFFKMRQMSRVFRGFRYIS